MDDTRRGEPISAEQLARRLDETCQRLAQAPGFAKFSQSPQVLAAARRLLSAPGGIEAVYERIGALEAAGIFAGSDWEHPERLQPTMAANTLKLSQDDTPVLECLSELRMLAIAEGALASPAVTADEAREFLARVLALNLRLVFVGLNEAERAQLGRHAELVQRHQRFIAERIGIGEVVEEVVSEAWRILAQRPIEVGPVHEMITSVAVYLAGQGAEAPAGIPGAERLISALYGPTAACREDPGVAVFAQRLAAMDEEGLRSEALAFARSLHETGLASPYHATLLRHVREHAPGLLPAALGLSSTGSEALACYRDLVHELIGEALWPETAQATYGLAGLLERGVLFAGPVAPALWRQLHLEPCPEAERLLGVIDREAQPSARARLLAGVVNVLGRPLGIGQGNSPTCQSARALSMWSSNDPDYLLQVVAWAARDGDVTSRFEGRHLSSAALLAGAPPAPLHDVDPVSAVTVPHLDALYREMGRLCIGRGEDPHRWVNPELHGWWVGHGFAIAVDVSSGAVVDLEGFVRRFYACYHPLYNGNNPVIHPQPAGVAVTNARAAFVGWHAIAIERVAMDPAGVVRVFFFNPNNDSTQDWGNGVIVATEGNGERHGESSLPFEQFASRLYLFHFDPREEAREPAVPAESVAQITEMALGSWAAGRPLTRS